MPPKPGRSGGSGRPRDAPAPGTSRPTAGLVRRPPPVGLTAGHPFAGGKVSRAGFASPHSPLAARHERATNGLLRQYFPKGADLSRHGPDDLAAVAAALNGRPIAMASPARQGPVSFCRGDSSDSTSTASALTPRHSAGIRAVRGPAAGHGRDGPEPEQHHEPADLLAGRRHRVARRVRRFCALGGYRTEVSRAHR
jgi:hypothetical protein